MTISNHTKETVNYSGTLKTGRLYVRSTMIVRQPGKMAVGVVSRIIFVINWDARRGRGGINLYSPKALDRAAPFAHASAGTERGV